MRYDLATKAPALCRTGAYVGCVVQRTLLNSAWTAAGAGGAMLALFEFERQHIQQAVDAIRQRLEQGLLFKRRDVEMKAQEVDQLGAAQSPLLDYCTPGLERGISQVAEEHLAQRVHRLGIAIKCVGPHRAPIYFGLPIRAVANLANNPELADTLEYQVVAAVRELEQPADFARASDLENIGEGIVI